MVKAILEEIPGRKVTTLRYGYFDLLRFWWPLGTRRTPVRRLARLIQIVRAEHPTEEIDVIAHSFGTYALARILHENRHVRLNRIILCGSVIAEGFRWEDVAGQITAPVLNECGTLDVWPVMASVTTAGFGATGTLGFGDPAVEDRYHKVAHSGCFDRPFVEKSWLPFLDTGVVCQSEAPDNYPRIRWWMSMLSSSLARYIVGAIMLVGLFTIPYRMSYYSRADPVGRALASLGYQRMIPGNTGWVWLGRYRTDERRWIEGPYFLVDKDAFLPRVPPQDGTIIVLERSSRIMVHG